MRYLYQKLTLIKTEENQMKQWIAGHILTADDLRMEETIPISKKEFTISLSMVTIALALFGFFVRVLGA